MPKILGNYVMEEMIGRGHFGEVYKGYNQDTGEEVAIKSMPSSLFVGKFKELFKNELKVYKTCKNVNIIKMYVVKKSEKHKHMILEYCNEGDLKNYLEKKGKLSESEAVEFLIQILNAFKTLVKYNIMHRDLKPANILKHNGIIKVADFGFCKLLPTKGGKTDTFLGSPLNMAPEVVLGKSYTNTADIWSIGTVFYELLFGSSIYGVKDMKMRELFHIVESHKIEIPKKGHKISQVVEDVLRGMLTHDPEKRITWEQLFTHKINTYCEGNTLKDLNILDDRSKFLIINNKLTQNLGERNRKVQINELPKLAAKDETDKSPVYNDPVTLKPHENGGQEQRNEEEKAEDFQKPSRVEISATEEAKQGKLVATMDLSTNVIKRNSNRTLHEINKCDFLVSTAAESSNLEIKFSNHASFVLLKKLNYMIKMLKRTLENGDKFLLKIYSIEQWEKWVQTKEYGNILNYILEEEATFLGYLGSITEKFQQGNKASVELIPGFEEILSLDLSDDKKGNFEEMYYKVLRMYLNELMNPVESSTKKNTEEMKVLWQHADTILNSLELDDIFPFENKRGEEFNFIKFYKETQQLDFEMLKARVNQRINKLSTF